MIGLTAGVPVSLATALPIGIPAYLADQSRRDELNDTDQEHVVFVGARGDGAIADCVNRTGAGSGTGLGWIGGAGEQLGLNGGF